MKDQVNDSTVIDRLRYALTTEALPPAARTHATQILKRLSSPVRVTLFGLPGSGKSEIVNMLIGRRLLPPGAPLATLELVHGPAERMDVTGIDGRVRAYDHANLAAVAGDGTAFIRVELPHPLLERVSLLEVVTDGNEGDLASAIDWGVRRTDIALWCSPNFDVPEIAFWSRVPETLKDHAFLVLTKADRLSAEGRLTSRVTELESVVSEEFHSLFAVATLQAIKAHRPDGTVDETMLHASGAGALASEILRHAERGRRADFDSAHLFLARYRVKGAPAPVPISRPMPAAAAPEPKPRPVAPPAPKAAPAAPVNVALFAEATQFIRRRAEGLASAAATSGAGATEPVLAQCVDAVEHLVDLFSHDESGCAAADETLDDLNEASDMMVLMQLEPGDGPVADAVTLLLQLRREMDSRLAA